MKTIQTPSDIYNEDPVIDIISGNIDSCRARELTESVTDIYELWALAKMVEHARREPIEDNLYDRIHKAKDKKKPRS